VTQKVLKSPRPQRQRLQDADEPFLQNWEFFVDTNGNEVWNDGVDSAKQSTDANGATTFTLTPGASYSICEVLKANWINTDPTGDTLCESTGTVVSGTPLADREWGNYQNVTQKASSTTTSTVTACDSPTVRTARGGPADDEVLLPGWTIKLSGTDGLGTRST
jgi:hypothetical protein